jgi:hypothetical protein
MKTEGLSNSKFASILGIQRSNITHIVDGRNKPSLSFVEKLMTKFPRVNIEWLINGTGEMYKQNDASPTLFPAINTAPQKPNLKSKPKLSTPEITNEPEPEPELISPEPESLTPENTNKPESKPSIPPEPESKPKPEDKPQSSQQPNTAESDLIEKNKERDIESVMIFYTDKTFKQYQPS